MTLRRMVWVLIAGLALGCVEAWDDGAASASPLVVGPDGFVAPAFGEGDVLAARLTSAGSDEPSFDEVAFDSLASDLEGVLSRVRNAYPEVAAIGVRPDYAPGELLVVASRGLVQTVFELVDGVAGSVQFDSGNLPFDIACVRLGLEAVVNAWPDLGMLHLYFGKYLNPEAAAGSFAVVEEVYSVSPNTLAGDGSNVEVEPLGAGWRVVVRNRFGNCPPGCLEEKVYPGSPSRLVADGSDVEVEPLGVGWRVVVRNTFGDCPSGCLEEEIRVFVVEGDRVSEVGPEEPGRAGGGLSYPVHGW